MKKHTFLLLLAAALATPSTYARSDEETVPPAPRTPTEHDEWSDLAELVRWVREDCGAPALAACVAWDGRIVDRAVSGVRQSGEDGRCAIDDRFHWGSITKAVTATVIGRLVEDGELSLDTTLGEALPDLEMREEYQGVTVALLLAHAAGLPGNPEVGDEAPSDPREGRLRVARVALASEPVAPPGTEVHYSNAGYTIAGVIAERVGDASWEDLVRAHVFEPLHLERSDLGWPATVDRPDQPRGHFGVPPDLRPQALGEHGLGGFDLDTYMAPAGAAHGSIEDLARFGLAHQRGLAGEETVLRGETIARLHTPSDDLRGLRYAGGWVLQPHRGEPTHWHNGSAGTFYALLTLYPESGLVVAVTTNVGPFAEPFAKALTHSVHTRYVLDADDE